MMKLSIVQCKVEAISTINMTGGRSKSKSRDGDEKYEFILVSGFVEFIIVSGFVEFIIVSGFVEAVELLSVQWGDVRVCAS